MKYKLAVDTVAISRSMVDILIVRLFISIVYVAQIGHSLLSWCRCCQKTEILICGDAI